MFPKTLMHAALVAGFSVAATAAFAEDLVIKIGHVAPTSGGQAHLGKDNENGANMAVDELNAKGWIIDGKKARFELLFEDDAADPKQGTAAATKLVDAKVNGVVGHLNSGTSIPASKIYSDAGIPQVSPASTSTKYTLNGYKTAFRVVANDAQLGGTLGRYVVKELKSKNIAVIDDRSAYGQGVAAEFARAAKAAGGKIVSQQYTTDKATEFGAILTAVKGAKPDVVFYGGMDAQAGPMLRQMKQLGMNMKFLGGDGICTAKLPELAGDAIGTDKVICAEAGGVTKEYEKGLADFRAKYKKRFNQDVQLYAPYVYDAVMVMGEAMKKANSADPAKYLPVLAKIETQGVMGPIRFDDKGDIKEGTLTMFTFKGATRESMGVVK